MSDYSHGEQAKNVAAADAHEEAEKVADTGLNVLIVVVVVGIVVHNNLDQDNDGWQTKCQHGNYVPIVFWVLDHKIVGYHCSYHHYHQQVSPRSPEHQSWLPLGSLIGHHDQESVNQNNETDDYYCSNRECVIDETGDVSCEHKDEAINAGDDKEEELKEDLMEEERI